MAEEKTPTWGYSRNGDEIFELAPGEGLPPGYYAHPAMIRGRDEEKKHRADAEKEGVVSQFEPKTETKPARTAPAKEGS